MRFSPEPIVSYCDYISWRFTSLITAKEDIKRSFKSTVFLWLHTLYYRYVLYQSAQCYYGIYALPFGGDVRMPGPDKAPLPCT